MMQPKLNAYVIDLEANNLYPFQDKVWTICIKRLSTGERLKLNPFLTDKLHVKHQILEFIFQEANPIIIGHNFLGFDGWVLWKEFDLKMSVGPDTFCGFKVTYFDTLFASQFLWPDRDGHRPHSLKSWGQRLGLDKIDYRELALQLGIITEEENEFCRWSEPMDNYCERDTDVCEKVFYQLSEQLSREEASAMGFRLGQKNFYLMNAQAFTGFKFDIPKARELKVRIEQMIAELKAEVEPNLPKRPLKKAEESLYRLPAKPFTKDGSYSALLTKKIEQFKAIILPGGKQLRIGEKIVDIAPHAFVIDELPMELDDQNALKEYFLSIGWSPSLWNLKKGPDGRPVRDAKGKLIQTSPKIQENHQICPNLLELDGELPKKAVKFLSLRNRLGVITGWLENERLKWDGRLPASSTGLAATHRQKHSIIVNVPKAQDDVLLGKEFRSLFTVEDGNKLIGCDQAALEARCEAHWVYKYPGGVEAANDLINGDLHSKNAKVFFPKETVGFIPDSPDFNKDDAAFKPYRSLSKNGKYALTYGCTPPKLAMTLRKPAKEARPLFDAYWAANPALKELKDRIEYFWEKNGKKWIPTIDGRKLISRSKHSLVNLLFQSTGAIIVDYALCLFDMRMKGLELDEKGRPYYKYKNKIVRRVGYFHDEAIAEVDESITGDIAKIMEECMVEAGERLELNVPLVGESKIGCSWDETH